MKIDRTPSPVGLRKIKVTSFKVFLKLKDLFKNYKQQSLLKKRYYSKGQIGLPVKAFKTLYKKGTVLINHPPLYTITLTLIYRI